MQEMRSEHDLHPRTVPIFDETYRVVCVETERLTIRGVRSGKVLVINTDSSVFLKEEDYPIGTLIALSDPSAVAQD